jgi:two-component system, OmpR family, phosphate regulon response regulator PhoB
MSDREAPLVLIAEDDRDTRDLYVLALETAGYRVVATGDGEGAVERAIALVPDVVVTDYLLPGLNGVSVIHRLRRDPRTAHVACLLVTGSADRSVDAEGAAPIVQRVLLKPCLPDDLCAAVAALVARRPRPA